MKRLLSACRSSACWNKAVPGLALLSVLALAGFVLHRPPAQRFLAKAPLGWVRTTQPGKTLSLVFVMESVFAGGRDGLFELDRRTGLLIRKVDLGAKPPHIRSLAAASDGSLWIGHIDGLIHWKGEILESWSEEDGLPANRVNVVKVLDGDVIIGTSRGLARLKDGKWQFMKENRLLASPVVNCLLKASDGALWVGSSSDPKGGLTRLFKGRADVWRVSSGLPHPYVQDLEEMPDGGVWVSTGQLQAGGAVRFTSSGGKILISKVETKKSGLAGEKVRSSGLTQDGRLVFGSENDGMAIWDGDKWQALTVKDGLPHNEVTAIETDSEGILWVATLNGVLRIDPSIEGSLPGPSGAAPKQIEGRSR